MHYLENYYSNKNIILHTIVQDLNIQLILYIGNYNTKKYDKQNIMSSCCETQCSF